MSNTMIIILATWAVIGLGVVLFVQCTKRFAKLSVELSNRGTITLMVLGGPLVWCILLLCVVKHYIERGAKFLGNRLKAWFFDEA